MQKTQVLQRQPEIARRRILQVVGEAKEIDERCISRSCLPFERRRGLLKLKLGEEYAALDATGRKQTRKNASADVAASSTARDSRASEKKKE
ncbi:hypothetical protein G4O51_01505 [Candidatus Bathyarchaeota archaeon A05DMB-2]|nr:hypothetical protein [Candidatus Bathyarchaeota archaeon A05DMB-2]